MLPLILTFGSYDARGLPAAPALRTRIDWAGSGWQSSGFAGLLALPTMAETTPAMDNLQGRVLEQDWTRGRSGDFSAAASGQMTLVLDNFDDAYTPDRNWCDNPSFEVGTAGWSVASGGYLSAGAFLERNATDAYTGAGSASGQVAMAGGGNDGAAYLFPYTFRAGVAYTVAYSVRHVSGDSWVWAVLGSASTGDEAIESAYSASGSWTRHTITWTPSADRSGVSFALRHWGATAGVKRIDAVQVNPGATANAYTEAPTRGMLAPGRIVTTDAAWGSGISPLFTGRVKSIAPNAEDRTVTIVAYDPLADLGRTQVAIPSRSRTHREIRLDALTAFGQPIRNLWPNGSVEDASPAPQLQSTGTVTTTRITTDAAPVVGAGSACAEVVGTGVWQTGSQYISHPIAIGTILRLSIWMKSISGVTAVTLGIESPYGALDRQTLACTLTTSWQRFTLVYTSVSAKTVVRVTIDGAATATLRWDAALLTVGIPDYGATAWFDALPRDPGFPDVMPGNMLRDPSSEVYPADLDWSGVPYILNGSFETDTAGWLATGNVFTSAADAFARSGTRSDHGSWSARANGTEDGATPLDGIYYPIAGTFRAGQPYRISARIWIVSASETRFGIGSQGTPVDTVTALCTTTGSWQTVAATWTPAADRTDAHLYFENNIGGGAYDWYVDSVQVVRGTDAPTYGAAGTFLAIPDAVDRVPADASGSTAIRVTATNPQAGIANLGLQSVVFPSGGRVYTALASVKLVSGDPHITVGLGSAATPAEAVTRTVIAGTDAWTPVRLVWRPVITGVNNVQLFVRSEVGGSVFLVDALAVWPGSQPVDTFEPPWVDLAAEDLRKANYTATSDVASILSGVNSVGYARHWVSPASERPYWRYRTRTVASLREIAEHYVEDIAGMTGLGLDAESVTNTQTVTSGTTWIDAAGNTRTTTAVSTTAGDGASLLQIGPVPANAISSDLIEATTTAVSTVADGIVAARKNARQRPMLSVTNRWPSQQTRDLDDLVAVTFARLRLTASRYVVQSIQTTISESGQRWDTTYQLEEAPSA